MRRKLMTKPLAILLSAAALTAGCASTPKAPQQARIIHEVTAEAEVHSIDAATREIMLELPSGERIQIVAGPEVRNFDQIAVGDTVTARYAETISARQLGADEIPAEAEVFVAAGTAEAGTRPAAVLGVGVVLVVEVVSLDLDQNLVVFTGPDGALHAVHPKTDEGKGFIKGLEAGDLVELTFTEEAMISVE